MVVRTFARQNASWRIAGLASVFALAACTDTVDDSSEPDARALSEGTGDSASVGTTDQAVTLGVGGYFEGYLNPATGEFDVWMITPEEWDVPLVDDAGGFRTTGHALDDYCIAPVTNGDVNTVDLDTVAGSIAFDDDCPTALNGFPTVGFNYSDVQGAYCANVRMRSFYTDPIRQVYAEITEMSDSSYRMYTRAADEALGLGNGAPSPTTTGNQTPTDENGGLVRYPDLEERNDFADEWWIFQHPSEADFFFRGRVLYSLVEVIDGEDNDCDGLIDEDTQSYPDGEECNTNLDCVGGVCDCAGAPCAPGETPVCRTPFCGDSIHEGAEECDTGGAIDSATCDFDCTLPVCGDDHVNAAALESCDPGVPGGFTAACDSDCTPAVCPDGLLNTPSGEICDDGNALNNDACLDDCTPAFCGDGYQRQGLTAGQPGYEECDDANTDNDDACVDCLNAFCGDGWTRTDLTVGQIGYEACDGNGFGTGGETASCDTDCTPAICGDGTTNATAGEVCDDAGDSQTCDGPAGGANGCSTATCGDGYANTAHTPPGGRGTEQCDLGSVSNSDIGACTSDCRLPYCGDGFHRQDITNPANPSYEECDEGPANSDVTPDACRSDCLAPRCGDDVIDTGEACDNGSANSDTEPNSCRLDCALFSCGDGVQDDADPSRGLPDEECDNGGLNSNTTPDACRENCVLPFCGDGVGDTGEACDDGDTNQNDGCLMGCIAATCGDGYVFNTEGGTEQCDDSNGTGGDGCSAICRVESGWTCPTQGAPCQPICGDGILRGDETCDDGNTNNGDGCDNTCEPELGWVCDGGQPTTCNTVCGDGVTAGTEQCDTSGIDTSDCNGSTCRASACGDNYLNTADGETCDDGDTSYTNACLGDCSALNTCGDGYRYIGVEACDGNGTGNGDETSTCNAGGGPGVECEVPVCGDGYVNTSFTPVGAPGPEQCDNGGANNDGVANACRTNCQNPSCGDGIRDDAYGEQCDNGPLNDDTASDACRTNCVAAFCGDGVRDIAAGEECDINDGVGPGQGCISCILDADNDGFLRAPYGNDCNDNAATINPGAAESTNFLDQIDSNCDDHNFSAEDTSIRIVSQGTCVGSPLGTRCYQQIGTNGGFQLAIDHSSSSNGKVFVRGTIAPPSHIILKNGVDIYGGWDADWRAWLSGFESTIERTTRLGDQYNVVLIGSGLTNETLIRYVNVRMNRGSTPTFGHGARTLHGISIGQSPGLRLYQSTVYAAAGFNGINSNYGLIEYPVTGGVNPNLGDCGTGSPFNCVDRSDAGGGNGWQLWCPLVGHQSYLYRGNSGLRGGSSGGSSIALLLGRSGGARVWDNTLQASAGAPGGSSGGQGGQGGNSVAAWFYDAVPSNWSVGGARGNPVDCGSNQDSNVLTVAGAGGGGSGTARARGRDGFSARCHRQDEIFEWFHNCSPTASTNVEDANDVPTMAANTSRLGRCSP